MIRCILFDMDGVLMDSERLHFQLWHRIFADCGVEVAFETYQHCIGSNLDALFIMVRQAYGVDLDAQREALQRRFFADKEAFLRRHGIPEIPKVRETVRQLHRWGYRMAVASSSTPAEIRQCVTYLGLEDCFEALCSGIHAPRPKPAPDVFLMAAEVLGVSPETCLVIEDSRNGTRAAQAAGMCCWGFENPSSGRQDLSAAQWRFQDFDQLRRRVQHLRETE